MELIKTYFLNGDYARWIKEFQRRDSRSISFTNDINLINRSETIQLVSLNPISIKSSNISEKDYQMLSDLTNYFDYLATKIKNPDVSKIIISIDNIQYSLYKSGKYITVIDTNDDDTSDPNIIFIN